MPEVQRPGGGLQGLYEMAFPTWTHDWRAGAAALEPVSGVTLDVTDGLVTDFTTLRMTSSGFEWDINNISGGLVRVKLSWSPSAAPYRTHPGTYAELRVDLTGGGLSAVSDNQFGMSLQDANPFSDDMHTIRLFAEAGVNRVLEHIVYYQGGNTGFSVNVNIQADYLDEAIYCIARDQTTARGWFGECNDDYTIQRCPDHTIRGPESAQGDGDMAASFVLHVPAGATSKGKLTGFRFSPRLAA